MLEEKTVIEKTEKSQEGATSLIDDLSQTDEGGKQSENVEKKEGDKESVYETRLKELEAETVRQKEIIEHKNRAINSLKKKKVESDEVVEEDFSSEEDDNKVDKNYVDRKNEEILVDWKLDKVISDDSEKKLVKYHYNNSIRKTGDIDKDLRIATAIANEHIVDSVKRNRAEADRNEREMTNFSSGMPSREISGSNNFSGSAIKKGAAALLDKIDPEAKKYL